MKIRRWTMRHPTMVVTTKQECEEAKAEARKWQARYEQELLRTDELHRRLMVFEEREQRAEDEARERAASPVHPNCMIGRVSGA